jgi:UDP-MurNAc hydroxylase
MKVKFLGHSSILIESGDSKVLCDPWYTGKVFNEGWDLLSTPKFTIGDLDFNYIWYSHEHPDHFSVPDIKSIPEEKRNSITILFQKTIDNKVKDFCLKQGFKVRELDPFKEEQLCKDLTIINGTDGFDSWLYAKDSTHSILNLNDCRLYDLEMLQEVKDKLGHIDALYTQFGYANWVGNENDKTGPKIARNIIKDQLTKQVEVLKPTYIIPFASFIYFCHEENQYWNQDTIKIKESYKFLQTLPCKTFVFYPEDNWVVGENFTLNQQNIDLYEKDFLKKKDGPFISSPTFSYEQLSESFSKMVSKLKTDNDWEAVLQAKYSGSLPSSIIYLKDLDKSVEYDITLPTLKITTKPWDIAMSSDSLKFIMDFKWGRGTLMINGRFTANYNTFNNFFKQTAIYYANNIGLQFPSSFTPNDLNKNSSFVLQLMKDWDL